MRGDFSRFTFDSRKHYNRVYMQQGRVQLDADWNEQSEILHYQLAASLKALFGPSAAPQATAGFHIHLLTDQQKQTATSSAETSHKRQNAPQAPAQQTQRSEATHTRSPLDFSISQGCYYVNGLLCSNEQTIHFTDQPYYPNAPVPSTLQHHCLVYLDVWQRHITWLEDHDLREVALNGLDTTTRMQTVWQVKLLPLKDSAVLLERGHITYDEIIALPEWHELLHHEKQKGRLSARYQSGETSLNNQLYRVEIHEVAEQAVTFKWSRENGAVVFALETVEQVGNQAAQGTIQLVVTLAETMRDTSLLQPGDWVELENDYLTLHGQTLPLYQVATTPDFLHRQITLAGPASQAFTHQPASYTRLRRWDHDPARAVPQTGTALARADTWLSLEHGIQVRFADSSRHEVGDYWLIPSRAQPAGIAWPVDEHGPHGQAPHGKEHAYCPLALLQQQHGSWKKVSDLRRLVAPLSATPAPTPTQQVLSEDCLSNEHLHTGDLVSLLSPTNMEVARTHHHNAHLVFGVVSGELDVAGERRYRVTIYGRARCHVVGPVNQGDLLIASGDPGHATRIDRSESSHHAGSIVGKALEAYLPDRPDQPGTITLLIALQ